MPNTLKVLDILKGVKNILSPVLFHHNFSTIHFILIKNTIDIHAVIQMIDNELFILRKGLATDFSTRHIIQNNFIRRCDIRYIKYDEILCRNGITVHASVPIAQKSSHEASKLLPSEMSALPSNHG